MKFDVTHTGFEEYDVSLTYATKKKIKKIAFWTGYVVVVGGMYVYAWRPFGLTDSHR